jgi:hypothetical protein
MTVRKSTGTVFEWEGPSVYLLDKKMKQIANGARAGQLARERGYGDIDIKKQVFVYTKAKK